MTEEQQKKIRQYYHSIKGLIKVFENTADDRVVDATPVNMLSGEIARAEKDLPGLLPSFHPRDFFSHNGPGYEFYKVDGIRAYLAIALAKLETEIKLLEQAPVTEQREFKFIANDGLRNIIERDYIEIQKAFVSACWKSVIILAGSIIEAILTDLLLQNGSAATSASKASKKPDISEWDLANLIDVSVELGLVSPAVEKLSHPIREYRNLVHPGNELRKKLSFGSEEARIALEVLNIVHRDLSK